MEGEREGEKEATLALKVGLAAPEALADRVGVPGTLPLVVRVDSPLEVPTSPPALALAVAQALPEPEGVSVKIDGVGLAEEDTVAVPERERVAREVEVGDWVPLKLEVGEPVQSEVGERLEEEEMEEVVERQAVGVLDSVALPVPV